MDISLLHGIWTSLLLFCFLLIAVWAYNGRNRAYFDAAAQIPFNAPEHKPRTAGDDQGPGHG